MDQPPSQPGQKPLPSPPLHSDDADEDDQSVKQLQECSSVYLTLQVYIYIIWLCTITMYTRVLINHSFVSVNCRIVL